MSLWARRWDAGGLLGAAVAAVWVTAVLVRRLVVAVVGAGMVAVEVLLGVLDWIGAEY